MTEADRIAKVYRDPNRALRSGRWDQSNPGNRAITAERRSLTRALLSESGWLPLGARRVLEVGSGNGNELAAMTEYGASPANLVGVELLEERVALARRSYPKIEFVEGNAERLEFPDSSFDMAMAITIFTSILDHSTAMRVAGEIRRVLKPGGAVLWYDFRYDNPTNSNVRGIGAKEVRSMFPRFAGELRSITLIPQIARRLGRATEALYPRLAALPVLRSHLLGLLIKPSDAV